MFESRLKVLEEDKGNYDYEPLSELVDSFVSDLIQYKNDRLLSIDKRYKSYGTWKSEPFINEYYYGKTLKGLLEKAIKGRITHDEGYEFELEEFEEDIKEIIFQYLYH